MENNRGDTGDAGDLRHGAEERLRRRREGFVARGGTMALETERLVHELQVHQMELEQQNEELQRVRAEVEEGLARYTELYEFAPAGYLTLGRDGEIRQLNLAGARLLGLERSRLVGARFGILLAADSRPDFNAFLAKVFASQTKQACELRTEGATSLALEVTGTAADDARECRIVATDITERKRTEEQLLQSEMKYRMLFESSTDAVMLLDGNGFLDCNAATVRTFGSRDRAHICRLHLADLSPSHQPDGADSLSVAKQRIATALKEGRCQFEWTHKRLDTGKSFSADVLLSRMVLDGRQVLQTTIRDTTERKQMQATLAQSDRLTSVGMLAAGVAHEVNQPLTYVLHHIESLAQDLPKLAAAVKRCCAALREQVGDAAFAEIFEDGAEILQSGGLNDSICRVREALSGTRRIRDVVRRLGTFSRVEHVELSTIDLRDAVESAIDMAFAEIKYRARLVKDFNKVPAIRASEGKLAQVFLNLLINAAHAIDEGNVDRNRITVRTWAEGNNLCAEVADTGKGIPPEILPRIFEPFFTTKSAGKGSGLGLAICRSIVTELGGEIGVESQVGKGTRVTIRLPVKSVEAEERLVAAVREDTQVPSVRGRILVVDDEPAILDIIARLLGREHEVVTAASGQAARVVLEKDASFDVILCDLMMPEMTGMDLHAWLAKHNPALAAQMVFVTGGVFTPRATEYLASVGSLKIEKPFDAASLKKLVAKLVQAARRVP
jgi:PAS domain S-box-containing protein